MSDIKSHREPRFLGDDAVRDGIDLLFFAYRDFTAEPDAILARYGFGRAHHRVIHFVGRHPQINVSELLAILRITKQSLARVLSALVEQGLVTQSPGRQDRRQRLLALTEAGRELERRLFERQRERLLAAFREAGGPAVDGFRRVLRAIAGPGGRAYLDQAAPK